MALLLGVAGAEILVVGPLLMPPTGDGLDFGAAGCLLLRLMALSVLRPRSVVGGGLVLTFGSGVGAGRLRRRVTAR